MKLLINTIAVAASLLSANALAGPLLTPIQSETTGIRGTGAAGNTTLTFDQFNPASYGGAQLESVHLDLDATAYGTYSYTDISGNTNNFQFEADVTVDAGGLIVSIPGLSDIPRSVGAAGTYQVPGYPDPLAGLTGSNSASENYEGGTLTPALIAMFQGAGTVDIPLSGVIAFNFNGSNDAATVVISRWEATLDVQYDYSEQSIPEPSTIALLGLGVAAISFSARRRKTA